jgi:small-conductance mechanosensitive channel
VQAVAPEALAIIGVMKSGTSSPPPIDDLSSWFEALLAPTALIELAVLAACVALAWMLVWGIRRAVSGGGERSILFGKNIFDGVLYPMALLGLAFVASLLLSQWIRLALFGIALPVLVSLVAIRMGVKVLQVAFKESPLVRMLERSLSWVAWIAVVLWVSGLLPVLLEEMEQISWKVGTARLSVRNLVEGGITAGLVLIVTLWISSTLEERLLRSATGGQLSVRKAISNALRALLMFVGLLVALSVVGIDLTALSVLGGAVGVGVGLGLQKLAANYVSGFVILAEQSIRIGDNVKVDNFEGKVSNINARYTVIRAVNGRESIVPNDMMVSSRIENLSQADPRLAQSIVLTVAYDSDVALVMRLLLAATAAQERVLTDPAPSVALTAFGADGLEFTVGYSLSDADNGLNNLRSLINLAILKSLQEHHIRIPHPQRVVHTLPAAAAPVASTSI